MVDITNKPIEAGDILLEVYMSGAAIIPHIAYGGFSPLYVRALQYHGGTTFYKGRVKSKSIIIISEEQLNGHFERKINGLGEESRETQAEIKNKILEMSRKIKNGEV